MKWWPYLFGRSRATFLQGPVAVPARLFGSQNEGAVLVKAEAGDTLTLSLASLSWSSSSEKLKLDTVMKSLMTGTNLSLGSRTWCL